MKQFYLPNDFGERVAHRINDSPRNEEFSNMTRYSERNGDISTLSLPEVCNGELKFDLSFDSSNSNDSFSSFSERQTRTVWNSRRCWAFFVSVLVHLILASILFSIVLTVKIGGKDSPLFVGIESEEDELKVLEQIEEISPLSVESTLEHVEFNHSRFQTNLESDSLLDESMLFNDSGNRSVENLIALESREQSEGNQGIGAPGMEHVGSATGRQSRKREALNRSGIVSKESEDAVAAGLDWLARHQLPDGGWSFELNGSREGEQSSGSCTCANSHATSTGSLYSSSLHPSRMAATAIALLPFLASGYTHTETNQYQKTVAMGLRFLEYRATVNEYGVDFREGFTEDGASYIQALAVLTCCEAFEMTKDRNLKNLAEGGLRFIENSQLKDGGWRYRSIGDPLFQPSEEGDLSVLGWQMLAVKSGMSAGFQVPASLLYRVGHFVDLVKDDNGRSYRYKPSSKEDVSKRWGTTAIGVLMLEYLGHVPTNDGSSKNDLDRGAEQIAKWLSSIYLSFLEFEKSQSKSTGNRGRKTVFVRDGNLVYNLYFAYYSILALQQYGGKLWEDKFLEVRNVLVKTQVRSSSLFNLKQKCEEGSWLFYDQYMNDGGRLLNTALALLILEAPYRNLPMNRL